MFLKHSNIDDKVIVITERIILLWIFVESGLGGLMHLWRIPFTGIVIGGFSVIVNILLAKYTHNNVRLMLLALGYVLAAKFMLSPQSPLGAYVAVAFQGLLGMLLFKSVGVHYISIIAYSVLTMLESAVQKPIMAYIIFGKELYQGLYVMVQKTFFFVEDHQSLALWLSTLYFLIYVAWGAVVGNWTYHFLNKVDNYSIPQIPNGFKAEEQFPAKRFNRVQFLYIPLILGALILYFLSNTENWQLYAIKTLSLLLLFSLAIPLIFKWLMGYLTQEHQSTLDLLRQKLNVVKINTVYAFNLSKDYKRFERWSAFIFLIVYLNIFHEETT